MSTRVDHAREVIAEARRLGYDPTTEALIHRYTYKFQAERGERIISSAWGTRRVHTGGEKVLHLPNGRTVKVTTDASGQATHVESDHNLHGIARPATHRIHMKGAR